MEKAQSTWPLLCREPSFSRRSHLRPPGTPSISFCTHSGGVFAPLVMLGHLKLCLQGSLSPGATATLKSSFHSVPTKAGNCLPHQTGDLYLPNVGSMVVLRAAFCCSRQSQPLTGNVANSLVMRQSQAARQDWVSELKFP